MRATRKGLKEDELAMFDLLLKDGLDKSSRERVKQASRELLAALKARLSELDRFWENEQTKADIRVFILDTVFDSLPTPPFSEDEKSLIGDNIYTHALVRPHNRWMCWRSAWCPLEYPEARSGKTFKRVRH